LADASIPRPRVFILLLLPRWPPKLGFISSWAISPQQSVQVLGTPRPIECLLAVLLPILGLPLPLLLPILFLSIFSFPQVRTFDTLDSINILQAKSYKFFKVA
jgi:hypothetical protein